MSKPKTGINKKLFLTSEGEICLMILRNDQERYFKYI